MQKIHIVGLLVIAAAVTVFLTAAEDVSTYASFDDAISTGNRVKISGALDLTQDMLYNPEKDPNYFSFFMEDMDGKTHKVVLTQPKPQDFERAESVVVTGSMKDEVFVATEVLTKCPSKYKNEELMLSQDI